MPKWATTAEVAAAAEITGAGVMLWVKKGVLPAYETVYGGKRGRSARWSLVAPAQAKWVREQLDAGLTITQVRAALERGAFTPPQ